MNTKKFQDQSTQLVVKSNDLIQQARYKLTVPQQKFIAYIVSLIKPTDENFVEYTIRVEDFCELTGIDKNHVYSTFQKMIDDIDNNKSFWVNDDEESYKFRWFDDTSYKNGTGEIKVILTVRLRAYLIGLTENFTQYELYNILALKSKYSIRLFELFKSYSYQKEKEFDINTLKELLFAETYVNYKDFRRRVLEPATQEINEYTELDITFEPVNKGKKVIAVRFIINQKEPSERYKSYQKTVDRITEKNKQIDGQMTIFDLPVSGAGDPRRQDN